MGWSLQISVCDSSCDSPRLQSAEGLEKVREGKKCEKVGIKWLSVNKALIWKAVYSVCIYVCIYTVRCVIINVSILAHGHNKIQDFQLWLPEVLIPLTGKDSAEGIKQNSWAEQTILVFLLSSGFSKLLTIKCCENCYIYPFLYFFFTCYLSLGFLLVQARTPVFVPLLSYVIWCTDRPPKWMVLIMTFLFFLPLAD